MAWSSELRELEQYASVALGPHGIGNPELVGADVIYFASG